MILGLIFFGLIILLLGFFTPIGTANVLLISTLLIISAIVLAITRYLKRKR
ncbi:hypothetical protein VBD025_15610 [Virgibacillus flavescens]|uniref:hypothetical protein n=1 Tax=Virgibacillus flavescens TaxID=1611422 RepID=UPI003D339DE8